MAATRVGLDPVFLFGVAPNQAAAPVETPLPRFSSPPDR
jgi:hypothetical protein